MAFCDSKPLQFDLQSECACQTLLEQEQMQSLSPPSSLAGKRPAALSSEPSCWEARSPPEGCHFSHTL